MHTSNGGQHLHPVPHTGDQSVFVQQRTVARLKIAPLESPSHEAMWNHVGSGDDGMDAARIDQMERRGRIRDARGYRGHRQKFSVRLAWVPVHGWCNWLLLRSLRTLSWGIWRWHLHWDSFAEHFVMKPIFRSSSTSHKNSKVESHHFPGCTPAWSFAYTLHGDDEQRLMAFRASFGLQRSRKGGERLGL